MTGSRLMRTQGSTHNGIAYTYSGSGPTILFIQGTGIHGNGWLPQVQLLSDSYRCVTFDNQGIGNSRFRYQSFSVAQMAEDALSVLDAVGCSEAHVIGHSLGSLVAQRLALNHRSRVQSLCLICTFSSGSEVAAFSLRTAWLGLRTLIGTKTMRRQAFLEMIVPPKLLKRLNAEHLAKEWEPLFGHDLSLQPPMALIQLMAMRKEDTSHELKLLRDLPVLVIGAAEDTIVKVELCRSLANLLPGSEYVEIPEVGHGLPIHAPGKLNPLILNFLKRNEIETKKGV